MRWIVALCSRWFLVCVRLSLLVGLTADECSLCLNHAQDSSPNFQEVLVGFVADVAIIDRRVFVYLNKWIYVNMFVCLQRRRKSNE